MDPRWSSRGIRRPAARKIAEGIAREKNLKIGATELDALVELLGADVARIATEIEKLSLYAGTERRITEDDIFRMAPSAKASTIFALVNAIGRNDRTASLESLDVLVREGEYLPLALSFLATQFRLAYTCQGGPTDEPLADSGAFHEARHADVEITGGTGGANRRSVLAREAADGGNENL